MRALLLMACGTLVTPAGVTLAADGKAPPPRVCVGSHSELPVTSLEKHFLEKKGRLKLDMKSPCLQRTGEVPVPAMLFALPELDAPYVVRIESIVSQTFVMPRIDMLGADHAPLRTIDHTRFKRRANSTTADIFMNAEHASERFLLIYADPAQIGTTDERLSMGLQSTFIGTGTWMSGSDTKTTVHAVETGSLVVSLVGERWEKAKKKR
jgi:hypothetical protein